MKNNVVEIFLGFLLLILSLLFGFYLYFLFNISNIEKTYHLRAKFDNVEGVTEGSKVVISGIVVGKVLNVILDKETFDVEVIMNIDDSIKIPNNSNASIVSNRLLGTKYILISPGYSDEFLKNDDYIKYTQGSINLENLIGKFMYTMQLPTES